MKKVVILATFLAATYAPSAFATAELKLSSGATLVDILDGAVGDSCAVADCVTFSGAVGSWTINVTTGIEGSTPFFDLSSVNVTGGQVDPISMWFSDDGLDFSTIGQQATLNVGGTVSTNKVGAETVSFGVFSDTVKFGTSNPVGSLVFHASPFSGSSSGGIGATDTALTLTSTIDLTKGAKGTVSFDAAVDIVPEPASITMLGGVLLILGAALRRGMKRA